MTHSLPQYFAIKRFRPNIENDYPELEPFKDLTVLIQSTKTQSGNWKIEMIKNPLLFLDSVIARNTYIDRWFNNNIVVLPIYEYNSNKIIQMRMRYNSISLVTAQYTIPILKIDKPCETLSYEFYSLTEHLEFSFDLDSLRISETEQINKEIKVEPKIPAHIIAAYVENLLNKKEVCPITMEPLERSMIYITDCGHAMSKSAACRWITEKKSCPVCRVECLYRA